MCWQEEAGVGGDCHSFLRRQAPLKCEEGGTNHKKKSLNITHLLRSVSPKATNLLKQATAPLYKKKKEKKNGNS